MEGVRSWVERLKLRFRRYRPDIPDYVTARVIYKRAGVELWLYPEDNAERIYLDPETARKLGKALIEAAQYPQVEHDARAARRLVPPLFLFLSLVAAVDLWAGLGIMRGPKEWAAVLGVVVFAGLVPILEAWRARKYRGGVWIK